MKKMAARPLPKQWSYRYPRLEAERNEAERRALKERNNG